MFSKTAFYFLFDFFMRQFSRNYIIIPDPLYFFFEYSCHNQHSNGQFQDEVAEWLRGWSANPLGFPRVDSNPILVDELSYIVICIYTKSYMYFK